MGALKNSSPKGLPYNFNPDGSIAIGNYTVSPEDFDEMVEGVATLRKAAIAKTTAAKKATKNEGDK